MATIDKDDIFKGTITHKIKDFPKAELFLFKDVNVGEDDLVDITGNYTSGGSTNNETILDGRVEDVDFIEAQKIVVNSKGEEVDNSPTTVYYGRQGGLVQELLDNELNHITHDFTQTSPYNYRAPHNFRNIADAGFPATYWVRLIGGTTTCEVIASWQEHKKVMELDCQSQYVRMYHQDDNRQKTGTVEFYVGQNTAVSNYQIRININGNEDSGISIRFYTGGYIQRLDENGAYQNIQVFSANVWYKFKIEWDVDDNWHLWIDEVEKSGVGWLFRGDMSDGMKYIPYLTFERPTFQAYFDAFGNTNDGNYGTGVNAQKEYNELDYSGDFQRWVLNGDKKIRSFFDIYSDSTLQIWYLENDLKIRFNDGSTDSGVNLDSTYKREKIKGKKQIKSYDKVILKGGYVGGSRIVSIKGVGDKIYYDTYSHIQDNTILDEIADNLLTTKANYPITVSLFIQDATLGFIQPGEFLSIAAGINFTKSSKEIPANDYIIRQIKYYIVDGTYEKIDLTLDDGLVFERRVEKTLDQENSDLIGQVAGGESLGEANTGSNMGVDGVGVYDSKTGATLGFRNIAPASSKITVTLNSSDIDLDVGDIDSVIEGIITAELVGGQSIDNAIDTLIAAHHDPGSDHHDDRYYTETEVDAIEDRFDEQSSMFPVSPVEGDRHYDEDDDSEYRYNAEAEAWIEVGVGGGASSSTSFQPPVGFITMFSGTWVDNSTIPGWYKCDGNNGTPNLVDKFVRGAATSGGSGGSDNAVVVTHGHVLTELGSAFVGSYGVRYGTYGENLAKLSTESTGVSGVGANKPAYYALIFIMRVS